MIFWKIKKQKIRFFYPSKFNLTAIVSSQTTVVYEDTNNGRKKSQVHVGLV